MKIPNYWRMFIFLLTNRRNYISILSIYFLTFPNFEVQMLGISTSIGNIAGFLLEVPSGYFSDRFGHKKTLILGKASMLISTMCFLFLHNFIGYTLGSVFLSLGFAFASGTTSAFFYESLESVKKEKEYSRIFGKLRGNVSLLSMILIILLPFFTSISLETPFIIGLFLDIIGLLISFSLSLSSISIIHETKKTKTIWQIFSESKNLNFLPFSIFLGSISGFTVGIFSFNSVYLEELGYPIIFIGFVMGLSRLVWFFVAKCSYLIEKYLSYKQWLKFELILYSFGFLLIGLVKNPYIVASFFIFLTGYRHGRAQVLENFIFKKYMKDKKYKATILSINSQISLIISIIVSFGISFVMQYSYSYGYVILSGILFIILSICYYFIFFNKKLGNL